MTTLYPDDHVWEARGHQSQGQGLVLTGSFVARANVGVVLAESRSGRTFEWLQRRENRCLRWRAFVKFSDIGGIQPAVE
jgi:hypothetical protein